MKKMFVLLPVLDLVYTMLWVELLNMKWNIKPFLIERNDSNMMKR